MGRIVIYRFTNPGDTMNSVLNTDAIQFNLGNAKKTNVANPFITRVTKGGQTAIADQQAPGQPTSNLQPLDKAEDLYTFYGYISKMIDNNGDNSFIKTLQGWDDDPAKVNTSWPQGRFGVHFDDMIRIDVAPVGTGGSQKGLIWQNLLWDIDWNRNPSQAKFTLSLKISRSNGT